MPSLHRTTWWIFTSLLLACEARPLAPTEAGRRIEGELVGAHQVQLEGVTYESWVSDDLTSRASASRASVDRRANLARAVQVKIERFDASGQTVKLRVQADKAEAQLDSRDFALEGQVELVDKDGRVARTERVEYQSKAERVDIPGPIRWTGNNFEASGQSARIFVDAERMEIDGPIASTVRPR